LIIAYQKDTGSIDGSSPSINTSAYAIDLAKKHNAELTVLYIVSLVPTSQFEYANVGRMKEIETTEMEKAQQEVDKVKEKAIEKNVIVETAVLAKYKKVVKEIVEYAEQKNIDMIVIRSRGRTGPKIMMLGSVASEVVTYTLSRTNRISRKCPDPANETTYHNRDLI
jgi:nucleotide-binding universal stress UspA family protein